MTLKEALARAELLQSASPASMAALTSCGSLRRVREGEHLFRQKEEVRTLYIVALGSVSLYRMSDAGEKKVVFLCGPGQTLNEVMVCDMPASISCEALRESVILCLPISQVISAMEQDFGLAKAMMDSMSMKIRRLYHQLKNTSNALHGDKKIASKLWKLSQDFGVARDGGTEVALDLTITFLADMLGSKRETVSRQVRSLSDAGLIRYSHSRFFVPDRDALLKFFREP